MPRGAAPPLPTGPRSVKGDVVVCDNRRVWHRTPPSLDEACADDDALMTVRLKHFPPR